MSGSIVKLLVNGNTSTLEEVTLSDEVRRKLNSGGSGGGCVSVTYEELLLLTNESALVPGMFYRITDYECKVNSDKLPIRVVSHPYDIIVLALTSDELSETAFACLHEGDNYYSRSDSVADLSRWELKYSLYNDPDRFEWADPENGKGVVYYLKDEHNNVFWYDFKQIQIQVFNVVGSSTTPSIADRFTIIPISVGEPVGPISPDDPISSDDPVMSVNGDTNTRVSQSGDNNIISAGVLSIDLNDSTYVYSVSCVVDGDVIDWTVLPPDRIPVTQSGDPLNTVNNVVTGPMHTKWLYSYSEIISEDPVPDQKLTIGCNIFIGQPFSQPDMGILQPPLPFYNITLGDDCYGNVFQSNAYNIGLGIQCATNFFDYACNDLSLGDRCITNFFSSNCYNDTLGSNCSLITFDYACYQNIIGDSCSGVSLKAEWSGGGGSSRAVIVQGYSGCIECTIGSGTTSVFIYGGCDHVSIGNQCDGIVIGPSSSGVSISDYCHAIDMGERAIANTIHEHCGNIYFGNNCMYHNVGAWCSDITLGDSNYYVTFGDRSYNIELDTASFRVTFGARCHNIHFYEADTGSTLGKYLEYVTFEDDCELDVYSDTSVVAKAQNIRILQHTTSNSRVELPRWRDYVTCIGLNSSGQIVTWAPADQAQS